MRFFLLTASPRLDLLDFNIIVSPFASLKTNSVFILILPRFLCALFEPKIDKVLLLYRPEYYGVLMDESGSTNRLVKMILAKNNKEYPSTFRLEHKKSFTRFMDELE